MVVKQIDKEQSNEQRRVFSEQEYLANQEKWLTEIIDEQTEEIIRKRNQNVTE